MLALVSYSFRNSFGRFGWLELIFMPPSAGQQSYRVPFGQFNCLFWWFSHSAEGKRFSPTISQLS